MPPIRSRIMTINVSTQTFVKILLIVGILLFAYAVRDIFAMLFAAFIISSALGPWVEVMQRRGVPRGVGILLIYLSLIAIVSLTLVLLVPAIAEQIKQLAVSFPVYSDRIVDFIKSVQNHTGDVDIIDQIKKGLQAFESGLLQVASGLFAKVFDLIGGVAAFFLVFVITFYMTVEENIVKRAMRIVTPAKYQAYITRVITRIQKKIGLWLRAQMILSVIIFMASFLGLSILGVDYALTLALVAGLTEFMPLIGPIVGAIPAVFIAFNQSPLLALWVLLVYILIQRLENDFLVPKIMQKAVGIEPLISIIALLIGARLGGIIGVLMAIPVTTAISVVLSDFFGDEELPAPEES